MEEIIRKSEIKDSILITLKNKETGDRKEAVVVRRDEGYECWMNYCKHITTVNIHKGGEAPIRGDEIVCQNHGAMFDLDSGVCTYGPCEGAKLDDVDIKQESGKIYLADEEFEFAKIGGIEDDMPSGTAGEDTFF